MSGADPTGPADDQEELAAEYVVGTLEAWRSRAVERAMETDPALRAAVAAMEADLAPLLALAPAEPPPEGLWDRIDQEVGALGAVVPLRRRAEVVRCPFCGSGNTVLESQFGSTACKSIRVCRSCLQPFEQFKAI